MMSFKCSNCDQPQPNGSKPNKVVVETRNVSYKKRDGEITTGTEIVKEINLCMDCRWN